MKTATKSKLQRLMIIALAGTTLSACTAGDRIKEIGQAPSQSPIANPAVSNNFQPVSMPMPVKNIEATQANSLWNGAQQGFFKDQRAKTIGDIMTVIIDIDDKGKMENTSDRSRATTESAAMPNLLGMEADLTQVLPEELDVNNLANATADSSYKGSGTTDRKEKIEMKLAATVVQVLPNGNMVIKGSQEVRVNYENRVLQLAGVVRPQDVNIDNTINYEQVAEARISYGGKGQITDVQQPRYGTQLYDIIFPF